MNYFEQLNAVDCGDKIEKKNGLSYLSWAWAWGELKKRHPTATYTIYESADGRNYHTDGHTCWVKTGVTVDVDGTLVEHIEYLPVMDFKNKSIPVDQVTSFDVNKAIQRSLTKAVARHGLGLYIYAGEDLPEGEKPPEKPGERIPPATDEPVVCEICGKRVADYFDGQNLIKAVARAERSKAMFGKIMCSTCGKRANK